MKKNALAVLFGLCLFLFSCSKQNTRENLNPPVSDNGSVSGVQSPNTDNSQYSTNRETVTGGMQSLTGGTCTPFPFGILGLNGGNFTINSATNLIADVGYSSGVISNTNQKIDNFIGKAYVHSNVGSFIYVAATYQPSNGILQNNAAADAALDDANANAISVSANYAALTPGVVLGNVTTNQTFNATGLNTVIQIASLNYNSNTLTLNGNAGADNGFIINVTGSFDFSQSRIVLNNVRPERVIFNFPNASNITINKASNIFKGTILAPTGNVIYHNPASFEGSIIALNIAVHSDFNLTQKLYCDGSSTGPGPGE